MTGQEAMALDKFTIEQQSIHSKLLMAWAAYACFSELISEKWFGKIKTIHILLGAGNNGGDGYALAWHLFQATDKEVNLFESAKSKTPDSLYFRTICQHKSKILKHRIFDFEEKSLTKRDLIIDAVFGTGLSRPITNEYSSLFNFCNQSKAKRVSIDISSGLFANGDRIKTHAFEANNTYTFGSYKIAHLLEPGLFYHGKVKVLPIGFDKDFKFPKRRLAKKAEVKPLRKLNSHKYVSGECFFIGGEESMEGAILMASSAFMKLGGGLSKIYSTANLKSLLKQRPELMINECSTTIDLEQKVTEAIAQKTERPRSAVLGIGLSSKLSDNFFNRLKQENNLNLVVDGSGLRQLKGKIENHKLNSLILTPHYAEAKSLIEQESIINVRESAIAIAKKYRAIVYFKGPGSILTDGDCEIYFNNREYQLATGGSGDLLCGFIANFLYRHTTKPLKAVESAITYYLGMAKRSINKIRHKHLRDIFVASDIIDSVR